MDLTNNPILRSLLTALFVLTATAALAIPAKPGLTRTITLADGTTKTARLVGDEFGHYWLSSDGTAYCEDASTQLFHPINLQALTTKAAARRSAANAKRSRRLSAPRRVGQVGNYTGKKKGIIILVNFSDKKFSTTNAFFKRIANEKNFISGDFKGSMYDYFYTQSLHQFELEFDVVGPVEVTNKRSYYGSNDENGDDQHAAEMVIEACQKANSQVDFSDYDWDGDKYVDQVYVVYADKGAADGGPANSIWPHAYSLSEAKEYGDGSGVLTLDGVTIDTYACGPELNGQTSKTAGIGTMCHEFSHCLGYPDFYDTDYSGGQGMGYWDLMDSGSYNGDGYQPAGYTSYERWVAGWTTPIELSKTTQVSALPSLQESGESYIIYNDGNRNEFYLLENRQKTGWDASLPGNGLLILHADYNEQAWADNAPNDIPSHQRMTWIPADNQYQYVVSDGDKYYTEEGMATDTYPYGELNSFGKNTTPAMKLFNKSLNGTYYLDVSVDDITQNSDGTIAFNFRGVSNVSAPTFSPAAGTYSEAQNVSISCSTADAAIHYTTDGSTPTASSPLYSSPILVESTTTLKAIAITANEQSAVATARYVIRTGGTGTDTNVFRRATSTDELVDGMRCIIACGSKQVAAGQLGGTSNSYLTPEDVDVDGDLITISDGVMVFTLNIAGNSYSLVNEEGNYLYASAVKVIGFSSSEKSWTLNNTNDGLSLTYGSNGTILYNVNSPRFTTYTSNPNASMLVAYLYVEDGETPAVKQDATLTFSASSATATLGQSFTAPSLSTDPAGIAVSYSSSDESVATVDASTGQVTPLSAGTATITATFAGNDNYNPAEASYTLTVKESSEGGEGTVKYVLVETDDLAPGDEVIVVCNYNDVFYALGTNQKKNNRDAVVVSQNDDGSLTATDETQVITLEEGDTGWFFNVGDGYLCSASSTKNWLHTTTTATDNAEATIDIEDGIAYITFLGDFDRNNLKFNDNASNGLPLFSCYATGQKDVSLYRKVVEEEPSGLLGDVNGDGSVDVTDVMLTVGHILGNPSSVFIFKNADINGDGDITVTDVMSIVNIVVGID